MSLLHDLQDKVIHASPTPLERQHKSVYRIKDNNPGGFINHL